MGILKKIRRHASVATGNFSSMFGEVDIPPLPAAAARLIGEINQPEPDMKRLVKVIGSTPELSAKVIQTVNSALFSLRDPVTTVLNAVTLLGLRHIQPIALSYAMVDAVPRPRTSLFEHQGFWIDSLFRAHLARTLARRTRMGDEEEAFTATLLGDVALPVLLGSWEEYYAPVIDQWRASPDRLSTIERSHFRWDHAQAGAWILRSWGFLDEMVCLVGIHNLPLEKIRELELEATIALPMATASLAPSLLKPDPKRAERFLDATRDMFSMSGAELSDLIDTVQGEMESAIELFGIRDKQAPQRLRDALFATGPEETEPLS